MFEWLKKKLSPSAPLWVFIISLIVLCGAYVLVQALEITDRPPVFSREWNLEILGKLIVIGITAIVTGGVLKVLLLQGYFEDALTNVIFGEVGLDRLDKERRINLWKTLTCKIHAPLIHEKIDTSRVSEMREKLMEAEGKQIAYSETFFVENIVREVEFNWADQEAGIVEMKYFFQSTLVPFNESKEIEWKSITTVDSNSHIGDYRMTETDLNIEGEDHRKRKEVISGKNKVVTYYLSGQSSYRASSTRTITWELAKDPIYWATSPYIVAGGIFKVANHLAGKRLIFQEIGGGEIFRVLEGENVLNEGQHLRRSVASVLLPRQGFQVIIL